MKNCRRTGMVVLILLCILIACTAAVFAAGSEPIELLTGKKTILATELTAQTDQKLVWETSDKTIATVSKGKVTGKTAGDVTITAQLCDKKTGEPVGEPETFEITVIQTIKGIKLSEKKLSAAVGDTSDPIAIIISDKTGVAQYDFSFEGAGDAIAVNYEPEEDATHFTITALEPTPKAVNIVVKDALSGKSAKLSVSVGAGANTVINGTKPIKNKPEEYVGLVLGKKASLKATAAYIDPENPNLKVKPISTAVNWSSSDETIAVVDSKGKVTPVGVGCCEITASAAAGTGEYTYFVEVWPQLKNFVLQTCDGTKMSKLEVSENSDVFLWAFIQQESFVWGDKGGFEEEIFADVSFDVNVDSDIAEVVTSGEEYGLLHIYKPGKIKVTVTAQAGSQIKSASIAVTVKPFGISNIRFEMHDGIPQLAWDTPVMRDIQYTVSTNSPGSEDYDWTFAGCGDSGTGTQYVAIALDSNMEFKGIKIEAISPEGECIISACNPNLVLKPRFVEKADPNAKLSLRFDESIDGGAYVCTVTGLDSYPVYNTYFCSNSNGIGDSTGRFGLVNNGMAEDFFYPEWDNCSLLEDGYFRVVCSANYKLVNKTTLTYDNIEVIPWTYTGALTPHEHICYETAKTWMARSVSICEICQEIIDVGSNLREDVLAEAKILSSEKTNDAIPYCNEPKPVKVVRETMEFVWDGVTYCEYAGYAAEDIAIHGENNKVISTVEKGSLIGLRLWEIIDGVKVNKYLFERLPAYNMNGRITTVYSEYEYENGYRVDGFICANEYMNEVIIFFGDYVYEDGNMMSYTEYEDTGYELIPVWQYRFTYYDNGRCKTEEMCAVEDDMHVVERWYYTVDGDWWKYEYDGSHFGAEKGVEYAFGYDENHPYVYVSAREEYIKSSAPVKSCDCNIWAMHDDPDILGSYLLEVKEDSEYYYFKLNFDAFKPECAYVFPSGYYGDPEGASYRLDTVSCDGCIYFMVPSAHIEKFNYACDITDLWSMNFCRDADECSMSLSFNSI